MSQANSQCPRPIVNSIMHLSFHHPRLPDLYKSYCVFMYLRTNVLGRSVLDLPKTFVRKLVKIQYDFYILVVMDGEMPLFCDV